MIDKNRNSRLSEKNNIFNLTFRLNLASLNLAENAQFSFDSRISQLFSAEKL